MAMTAEQLLAAMELIANNLATMQEQMKMFQEKGNPEVKPKHDKRSIEGKSVDNFRKFQGGEAEWNAWADDFKIVIDTRNEQVGNALEFIRALGKVDREVLEWKEVCRAMYDDMDVLNGLDQLDKEDVARLSKELYRAIHMTTTDVTRPRRW